MLTWQVPYLAPVTQGKRLAIASNGKTESQVPTLTPRASQTTLLSLLHINLTCLLCKQVELRLGSLAVTPAWPLLLGVL